MKIVLPYENSIEDARIVIDVQTDKTEVADTDLLISNNLRLYKDLLGKIKERIIYLNLEILVEKIRKDNASNFITINNILMIKIIIKKGFKYMFFSQSFNK